MSTGVKEPKPGAHKAHEAFTILAFLQDQGNSRAGWTPADTVQYEDKHITDLEYNAKKSLDKLQIMFALHDVCCVFSALL